MFVSAVCSTGDLCFYHKNAIIVPMITLKFGIFTDIKSGFFSSKKTSLIVVLIHVYNVKPVSKA